MIDTTLFSVFPNSASSICLLRYFCMFISKVRKRSGFGLGFTTVVALISSTVVCAQDLAPRACLITPVKANAFTITWSGFNGGIDFNGAVPIRDATGTFGIQVLSYYHSFNLAGRSANIAAFLPYGVGNFQGNVRSAETTAYRSDLLDTGFRLSVNLKGGPAMGVREFVKWRQKTMVGASLRVIAPTGQYDPNRLINWSIGRWAFKPEVGYSRRRGNWLLDGYAGVWLYTTNQRSFAIPAPTPQKQSPVGSFEGHLSYDAKPRLWFSADVNFWLGGTTSVGGVANPLTRQTSSRIGGTASFPISKSQAVKITYSDGIFSRVGSDYKNLTIGWQYSWIGKPK